MKKCGNLDKSGVIFSKVKVSGKGQQMQTKMLTYNPTTFPILLQPLNTTSVLVNGIPVWRPLSSGLTPRLFVLQSFAENTMNELLGWYGYDKVELRDSDSLDIGETPQHISVLKGMEVWHPPRCFGVFYEKNVNVASSRKTMKLAEILSSCKS